MAAAFVCALLLTLVVFVFARDLPAQEKRRLAVLVAAPWEGETVMSQDMFSMADALRQRGFAPGEVVGLEGVLTRNVLLDFVANAGRRIATWDRGDVVFFLSGHGTFSGTTVADARPGVRLSGDGLAADYEVFWDEIFAALRIPNRVRLIVLPDT